MPNASRQLWIPDDVWLEILENHIPVAHAPGSLALWQSLSSLSLTCRRLRRIMLPAVYHSLTFSLSREETQQGGLPLMRSVQRARLRANRLAECPHFLRHVREFTLVSWDLKILGPRGTGERGDADAPSSEPQEDGGWAAYDVVAGLISQMPGLRKLRVLGSAITLRLHLAISFHRCLDSLVLSSDQESQYCDLEISKFPMIPFPVVPNPTIRHLDLTGLDPLDESVDCPDYVEDIIRHSLREILSLKIYFFYIPRQLSVMTDLSSLRSLTVELEGLDDDYDYWSLLRDVLGSSPALHTLKFFSYHEWTTDEGFQDLPGDALPKLEVISGPPEIVNALIPGRPVNTVHLRIYAAEALESFDILASSAAQIHTLEMDADVYCFHDMLTVTQFPVNFMNLTHLKIRYQGLVRDDVNAWEDPAPQGDRIAHMLAETLSRLPQLLVYWLHTRDDVSTEDQEDLLEDEDCPIGAARDPDERGHPSLEEILLFDPPIWRWYPGEGWTPQILPRHVLDM